MQDNYLFILPSSKLGGAERVALNLIYYLLTNNHQVTLLTMSGGKSQNWQEFNNYSNFFWISGDYNSEKASLLPITFHLIKLSLKYKYNYIYTTHVHTNSYLSFLKKLGLFTGSKLISRESFCVFLTYKIGIKKHIFKLAYRFLYGEQDLLIFQTDEMKKSLETNLGYIPAKKSIVLPNPVNIDLITAKSHKSIKKKYIVACGSFIDIKQFDVLVNAFQKIHRIYPDYKLVIIGDGPNKKSLQSQIDSLQLKKLVILPGRLITPYEWFSKSEIGVISSKREGFPNVLLEMMACGVNRIVSTPCTKSIYTIPNIIVTKSSNENDLYDGLLVALKSTEKNTKNYQEFVHSNHSVSRFLKQVNNIVNSVN